MGRWAERKGIMKKAGLQRKHTALLLLLLLLLL